MEEKDKPVIDTISIPAKFNRAPKPTVMMFKPDSFEILSSDKLEEWESMLLENVGLSEAEVAKMKISNFATHGVPTVSATGGVKDDCDEF